MNKKQLNFILQEGEGLKIEFKESFDKSLAKEIVAFANSSGGRILLGVGDKGKLKGIKITNKLKSQIQDIARNCDPEIKININIVKSVLIINIEEGKNKPYSCSEGFFMRMGSNSQKIKRDEILKLAVKWGKVRFDEQICKDFNWSDFDLEKFKYYLKLAHISYNLDEKDILRNLKVLTDEGFTNTGVLFFAKEPYKYISTSKVRCVHFADDERVEILDKKEIDRGIIDNIRFAINYLKDLVPVKFEIKGAKRVEYPDYPIDAYREVIVNAIVHRDYFNGDEVAVEKLKSSIFINNKGGLLFSEKDFGKKSEQRNRLIADLLSKTNYMEKVGTGIKRIKDSCKKNHNFVEFVFRENDFWVKIYKSKKDGEKDGEKDGVKDIMKLSDNQKKIIMEIKQDLALTSLKLSNILGISLRNVEKNIAKLKQKGLLKRVGPDKGGYWEIKIKEKNEEY